MENTKTRTLKLAAAFSVGTADPRAHQKPPARDESGGRHGEKPLKRDVESGAGHFPGAADATTKSRTPDPHVHSATQEVSTEHVRYLQPAWARCHCAGRRSLQSL